ncbi:hypothetical protein [uncultured Amnibacterium sp.]|uniref:hypothetical protein n=1 Tax=uncultured Amnibacterium sp. TaxID=1631851 RepID=UPI0035CB02EE
MPSPTVARRRRRRLLAVGTAGLALCIGVSVTSLAAWQQNVEIAGGSNGGQLGSSLLKIELSLDGGTTWTAATVSSNGSLNFGSNASLLTPGDTVYASVLLRAAVGSRGADVKLSGGTVGSDVLLGALTYAARTGVVSADCKASTFASVGQTLVSPGSILSAGSGSTAFSVPAATSSAPGTAVGVCLAVSLPSGVASTVGGLTTSPVWRFDATSV